MPDHFDWSVQSLSSTTLVQVAPGGYSLTVSGSGIGPVSSLDALEQAIDDGIATGTLNEVVLRQGASEIVRVDMSPAAYIVSSGSLSVTLTGGPLNSFAEVNELSNLLQLADLDDLYAMSSAARAQVFSALSDYSLTGLTIANGATTLFGIEVTSSAFTLDMGGYKLQIDGDFPADLGQATALAFDAHVAFLEGAVPNTTTLFENLDITTITFTNPEGQTLFTMTGSQINTGEELDQVLIDGFDVTDKEIVWSNPIINVEFPGEGVWLTAYESSAVIGSNGHDRLDGSTGDDLIYGFGGEEYIFIGNGGNDTIFGGADFDTLVVDNSKSLPYDGYLGEVDTPINVNLATGIITGSLDGVAFTHRISGIEGISRAIGFNDTITGSGSDEYFDGHFNPEFPEAHDGSNKIYGMGGNDTIDGWVGNDLLAGGAGNDLIWGTAGENTIYGGLGNDTVQGGLDSEQIFGGGNGTNRLFGNDGNDSITAGSGGDFIGGGAGDDLILGGAGNDTVYGGLGNDRIGTSAGNDLIYGVAGNNRLFGGLGNDTIYGGTGNDLIHGEGNGTNVLLGEDGNDTIYAGSGNDFLAGGAGNDRIFGGDGNNTIYLGAGNDFAGGGAGDDLIFAGAGDNRIYGGLGDDTIHAGAGRDVSTGGPGADVFVFASAASAGIGATRDVITDFTAGIDHIDLSALNLTFIGNSAFSGTAGELRYIPGFVVGDIDGDGNNDFAIELSGAPALTADDFIL